MFRYLFLVILLFIFTSCSANNVKLSEFKNYKIDNDNKEILEAFVYKYKGENKKAQDLFLSLFNKYQNDIFLENAFVLSFANDYYKQEDLIILSKPYLQKNHNLARLSALYYFRQNDINQAYLIMNDLMQKEQDYRNYELYADILTKKAQYKKAIDYYNLAYEEFKNESILLKIIQNYAFLNDKKSIKRELEKSVKEFGCYNQTCNILAQIYLDEKDYKKLENIYLELFFTTQDQKYLYAILEILNSTKQYKKALNFALKYKLNQDVILFLYQLNKEFENAYKYAYDVYTKTKNKEYLLKSAVFEFENATYNGKINDKIINSVKNKFEQSINENSDPLYLNYYGYLLIDNDLDVKNGIKFIELALKKDPNNLYYIDSLAWGYYKLKDCKKAWELFQKTLKDKEFSSSKESKAHEKAILKCLKKN